MAWAKPMWVLPSFPHTCECISDVVCTITCVSELLKKVPAELPTGFYRTRVWVLTSRNAAVNIHSEECSSKHTPNKNVEIYRKTAQLSENLLVLWHGPASLLLSIDAANTYGVTPPSGYSPTGEIPWGTFLCFLVSILFFWALWLCVVCISSLNHPRIRTPKPKAVLTGKMQIVMGDMQNYFYL